MLTTVKYCEASLAVKSVPLINDQSCWNASDCFSPVDVSDIFFEHVENLLFCSLHWQFFNLICLESSYKSPLCFNIFFCWDRQGQYKKNKRIGVLIFVYKTHSFSFPLMQNFLECWTITFLTWEVSGLWKTFSLKQR